MSARSCRPCPPRAHAHGRTRLGAIIMALASVALLPSRSAAQWDESVHLNAMMKLQAGVFVPLASDRFQPLENIAEARTAPGQPGVPCDPVATPRLPCYPLDHGKEPGTPSIARATLQLEGHWDFSHWAGLHAIVRAVRSAPLEADEYARPPILLQPLPGESQAELSARRRQFAKDYAHENYYQEMDLREFYLDLWPTDWLSFRIGRQQVAWGETGQYRMLDVINPQDSTWRFGPLESFEDQRIPLWMLLTTFDIPQMNSALELVYIPGVDRARNTVNPPLSFVGAWGIPYSSSPPTFAPQRMDFRYPGGELDPSNMRGGARLKGVLGDNGGYSLVYMSTHMMRPVLTRVQLEQVFDEAGNPTGTYNNSSAEYAVLEYPRKHVVGGSFEVTVPSPVASTIRFEGAVETNRAFSPNTSSAGGADENGVLDWPLRRKPVINYAMVFQRPTMIRWLNPTQNVLLVAQFMHTAIPTDPAADQGLVHLIGYNDWQIQKHSYTTVLHARTTYAHGLFEPRVTGAWIRNPYYKDSGFVTVDLGFRIGPHYRLNLQVTDFVGKNAYRDVGLFRDRDEVHAAFTVLF